MNDLNLNVGVTTVRGPGNSNTARDAQKKPAVTPVPLSIHERRQQWMQKLQGRGVACPSRDDIQDFLNSLAPLADPDGGLYFRGDEKLSPEDKEYHVRIVMLGAFGGKHNGEIEDRMIELRRAGWPYVKIYNEIKHWLDENAAEKPVPEIPTSESPVPHATQPDGVVAPVRPAPGCCDPHKVVIIGGTLAASVGGAVVFGPLGLLAGIAFSSLCVLLRAIISQDTRLENK
ncbi:MAG: hypothetical protein LBB26_04115 [Puniceicoccales bacterium]|jgi:hypothetical protein|nr:hypothetical protein [Puniceicoccales bacterium]